MTDQPNNFDSDEREEELGLKRLSVENWRKADSVISQFVHVSPECGAVQTLNGDDWAAAILRIDLTSRVPLEIRRLFAVARGAFVYGYYFYPMFTLGAEQLFRVADTATGYKCQELGIAAPQNFAQRLKKLVEFGAIPEIAEQRWDALRRLRNLSSHPEDQAIFTPGVAIDELHRIANGIEGLFVGWPRDE